jgi:hypothetical protein
VGPVEQSLAEEIAVLLWRQRQVFRLREHLTRLVTAEARQGRFTELRRTRSVNAVRLEKLASYGEELDRRMAHAYRRLHDERELRLRPAPGDQVDTDRRLSRTRRSRASLRDR